MESKALNSICLIRFVESKSIKKGDHVILQGRPAKIRAFSHAKTGKHGHCKVSLTGVDLFTQKKVEWKGAGHNMLLYFEPVKREFPLLFCSDSQITCLDKEDKEFVLDVDEKDPKLQELKKMVEKDVLINVTLLTVPIETASVIADKTIIDSFKESQE